MKLPLVSATDPTAEDALQRLDAALAQFYNGTVVADYYRTAHAANAVWAPDSYHQIIKRKCNPGARVIDLGCGSGHAFVNLAECRVNYTGVDWSREQIVANQTQYPDGTFVASPLYDVQLPNASFD